MKQEEKNKSLIRVISAMMIVELSPVEIADAAIKISDTERTRSLLEDMKQKFNEFQESVRTIFEHLKNVDQN